MSTTTTIHLSAEERALLGELAEEYGNQTGAIRQGIILLARGAEGVEFCASS